MTFARSHRLTPPAYQPIKPSYSRTEMSSLEGTAADLKVLIQNTKSYLASPQSDAHEKLRLEQWIESLTSQLEDIERQLRD